jgi:hypothetical protein
MVTATDNTHNHPQTIGDRYAVRFLLDHRLGRLLTEDPISEEPFVTPVHYVSDGRGGFVTTLPADSPHIQAIRKGGLTLLSVSAHRAWLPRHLDNRELQPADRIWHVQADVTAEVIEDPAEFEEVLRKQIASVLDPLPQHDKTDPLPRAGRTALTQLVAVRLRINRLRTMLRGETTARDNHVAA